MGAFVEVESRCISRVAHRRGSGFLAFDRATGPYARQVALAFVTLATKWGSPRKRPSGTMPTASDEAAVALVAGFLPAVDGGRGAGSADGEALGAGCRLQVW